MQDTMGGRGELAEKFRGALVGGAVGDALGAPFEGRPTVDPTELAALDADPGPLRYTDDTHMALGVAASLVERRGFDGPHMAELLASNFEAQPWRGYGATPPQVFALMKQGVPWDQASGTAFSGRGSFGNGAAMRVAPAALLAFPDLEQTQMLARGTAIITHAHELGIQGAVLQACAVALALPTEPGASIDLQSFLEQLSGGVSQEEYHRKLAEVGLLLAEDPEPGPATVARRLGHGIAVHESVPAAIYAFLRYRGSFSQTVKYAIGLGGDTDTIACMAGAISGAYLGIGAVPQGWRDGVEAGAELVGLADALLSLALEGEA